jgi:hypothetical protein
VYVDEDELDLDFIASLMSLQAATRRQLQFTGRVVRVVLTPPPRTRDFTVTLLTLMMMPTPMPTSR